MGSIHFNGNRVCVCVSIPVFHGMHFHAKLGAFKGMKAPPKAHSVLFCPFRPLPRTLEGDPSTRRGCTVPQTAGETRICINPPCGRGPPVASSSRYGSGFSIADFPKYLRASAKASRKLSHGPISAAAVA